MYEARTCHEACSDRTALSTDKNKKNRYLERINKCNIAVRVCDRIIELIRRLFRRR